MRALYASTRDEELALSGWDEQQAQAFIAMQFNAQSQQYLMSYPDADRRIVMLDGRPIGRLLVDRAGTDILLVDIAFLSEFRGSGVGTFLIRALLREARTANRSVRLHVLRWNIAARLYERLGFTVIGDDGVYFEMIAKPAAENPATNKL